MKLGKRLQVKVADTWAWVFCYNTYDPRGPIITTQRKAAALPACDLEYFTNRFGRHEFRAAHTLTELV